MWPLRIVISLDGPLVANFPDKVCCLSEEDCEEAGPARVWLAPFVTEFDEARPECGAQVYLLPMVLPSSPDISASFHTTFLAVELSHSSRMCSMDSQRPRVRTSLVAHSLGYVTSDCQSGRRHAWSYRGSSCRSLFMRSFTYLTLSVMQRSR